MTDINNDLIYATLKNAEELIVEARILVSHDKFARGFTLTHIGTEETAKALVFLAVLTQKGSPVPEFNMKRLRRALQTHKFKIAIANWFDDVMTGAPESNEEDKAWRKLLVNHDLYNQLKNDSLYVGVGESSFPTEKFAEGDGPNIVRSYLAISESRIQVVKDIVNDTLARISNGTVHKRDPELGSAAHISMRHAILAFVFDLLAAQ